jgi:hypothetical protein
MFIFFMVDFFINLFQLWPLLIFDDFSSLHKKSNHISIRKAELKYSNFNFLYRFIFKAKIRKLRNTVLKLIFEPVSEGL